MSLGQGRIERNGHGTHFFVNGMEYCGNWNKDKMNGPGM